MPNIAPDDDNLTAALKWAEAGWYVLPVKRGTKNPGSIVCPKGEKRWQDKPSRDPKQITAWFAGTGHGIALHCGRSGALAFDADHHEKLPEILRRHIDAAPFQQTRPDEDPQRGHYVFAMPPGRMLGNGLGRLPKGWGEIRGANGVIVVAPNDDGRTWKRTGPVPALPDEIADMLDDASPAEDAATDEVVVKFIAEHTEQARPTILLGWVSALRNHFDNGQSRHTSAVSVLTGAMKEARADYFPAQQAVDTLRPMFLTEVAKPPTSSSQSAPRTGSVVESEFAGILAWAIGQALAADLGEIRQRVNEKMPDDDETITHSAHLGMAHKLATQFNHKLLYVNKHGWHRWDGQRWAPDENGAARRAVHAVIARDRRILERLKLANEEYQKRARQIARYETASAITGILTEAAALKEFSVQIRDLDADPWLFNCANGTLDLRTMTLRPHDQADRITKVANAAYDPKAIARVWPVFLAKVLPDKDVRDYFRRLVAMGLLGEVNGDKQIGAQRAVAARRGPGSGPACRGCGAAVEFPAARRTPGSPRQRWLRTKNPPAAEKHRTTL